MSYYGSYMFVWEKVELLDLTWQNMSQIPCTSVSQMPLDTIPLSQYSKPTQISVLFFTWPFRPLSAGHSKDVWEAFEAFHCSSGKRGKRTISQRWDELKPVKAPHFTSSPLDLHLDSPLSLPFRINWCLMATKISWCLSHKAIVPNTVLFTPRTYPNYKIQF